MLAVLLITFTFISSASASSVQSREEKYRIIEVVLRRYMKNYPPAKGYKLYYIGVELDGKDVTNELLKRLSQNKLPVREFKPDSYNPELVKRDGGIVLGVSGMERINRTKVKVYGLTFVSSSREGLNWIHEVERRGRSWVITNEASLNLS
jgi:hypothetical protein